MEQTMALIKLFGAILKDQIDINKPLTQDFYNICDAWEVANYYQGMSDLTPWQFVDLLYEAYVEYHEDYDINDFETLIDYIDCL